MKQEQTFLVKLYFPFKSLNLTTEKQQKTEVLFSK
jgi:hypothetical protein